MLTCSRLADTIIFILRRWHPSECNRKWWKVDSLFPPALFSSSQLQWRVYRAGNVPACHRYGAFWKLQRQRILHQRGAGEASPKTQRRNILCVCVGGNIYGGKRNVYQGWVMGGAPVTFVPWPGGCQEPFLDHVFFSLPKKHEPFSCAGWFNTITWIFNKAKFFNPTKGLGKRVKENNE